MRTLVTGAAGLLGGEIVKQARSRGYDVIGLTHADLDVTDEELVTATVAKHAPDAIVHCAAYTAVDRAEAEPDVAMAVNRDGARNVALGAAACGAAMMYVSTDYVFDGSTRRPYLPDDPPRPLSAYGRSKLAGEKAVRAAGAEWMVARTSWLYGGTTGFLPAMLRRAQRGETLRIVDDQRGRPPWAPDAAEAMVGLVERGARGVWHVADGGDCTRFELVREAVRLCDFGVEVVPVSSGDFAAPASRPEYSVLDLQATERLLGRPMSTWKESLAQYIREEWEWAAPTARAP